MFKLEIKTVGAVFRDDNGEGLDPYTTEVRRILLDVICELEAGRTDVPSWM